MPYWAWLVFGFLLLAGETLSAGAFYLLFFGLGAVAVGLLALASAIDTAWIQWLVFSVLSVAAIIALRPATVRLLAKKAAFDVDDTLVGETVTLHEPIEPGGLGRGEMRGTPWSVRNESGERLAAGDRALVSHVEGLTLHVRKSG
jgi:membrane protein implicated in regulation of membrane protease activity